MLQYYTGTQNGVLIIEVSTIQRFVIERFHCNTTGVNDITKMLSGYIMHKTNFCA